MGEGFLELRELLFARTFVPVGAMLFLLVSVGTGGWRTRWVRTTGVVLLAAVVGTFVVGIFPHQDRGQEWSEVLFNGQLL